MGKTAIALALLRHGQIAERFGVHRYFVSCDVVEDSLDGFLERLSHVIGAPCPTDMAQLWSRLESSPCILVLDGVDSVLDPRSPGAAEIATAIEEFGRSPKIFLLVTTRMDIKIPDFFYMEVPALPVEAARDAFLSRSRLGRSAAVDGLLEELEFHPLSITLLASAVNENNWDEPALLKAWDNGKTSILKTPGGKSLKEIIESILRAPTIQNLGVTAQRTLEAIATYPGEVREIQLLYIFPGIDGIGDAVDGLCKYSLLYRKDGFVKMLSPFRLYFGESIQTVLVSRPGNHAPHTTIEDIQYVLVAKPRIDPPLNFGDRNAVEPCSCPLLHPLVGL